MGNQTTKGIKVIKTLNEDHIIKTLRQRIEKEGGNFVITLDSMDMVKCVVVCKNKLDSKTRAKTSVEREFTFNPKTPKSKLVEDMTKIVSDSWTQFINEDSTGVFNTSNANEDIVQLSD